MFEYETLIALVERAVPHVEDRLIHLEVDATVAERMQIRQRTDAAVAAINADAQQQVAEARTLLRDMKAVVRQAKGGK